MIEYSDIVRKKTSETIFDLSNRPTASAFGVGDMLITTPQYQIKCRSDGVSWFSEGSSALLSDMPTAATLGKGTWTVGNNWYSSNGAVYTGIVTTTISTTWSNRASAIALIASSSSGTGSVFVSDVGLNGSLWYCDGVRLINNSRLALWQDNIGYIVPGLAAANAATYSQTGTLITVTSTGHNIPAITHNSKTVYLAMGVAATGATIPAGWFTNFQYVDANTFTCVSATSQTGTGTVNTNIATITIPNSYTVKGGLMGVTGKIIQTAVTAGNNSAGFKYFRMYFGGIASLTLAISTIIYGYLSTVTTNKNNDPGQQTSSVGIVTSVNTSADFTITQSLTASAASDYAAVESSMIELSAF